MEFYIDVHTSNTGKILIKDHSREYDQYVDHDVITDGKYQYDRSVTIDVLSGINTKETKLLDTQFHNHDQLIPDPITPGSEIYDIEKTILEIPKDGYYQVQHIVLPTIDWYNYVKIHNNEFLKQYNVIYIGSKDGKILKEVDNQWEECSTEELINRNTEGTTIEKCVIDVFHTGFLYVCYINYCKKLFDILTKHCMPNCIPQNNKELTYIRDFLWMVLNIIDYLVDIKQHMEAQRILEIVNHCGGFCKNLDLHDGSTEGCGCS